MALPHLNRYYGRTASQQILADSATLEAKVEDTVNYLDVSLTQNATLSLHNDSKPAPGDEIVLKVASDSTGRDVSMGSGFKGPTLSGVANKTKTVRFMYDGTNFVQVGASVQID
jgi:hypothetical protein